MRYKIAIVPIINLQNPIVNNKIEKIVKCQIKYVKMVTKLDSWHNLLDNCKKLEFEVNASLSSSRGYSTNSQTEWRQKVQESLGRFTLGVLSLRQKMNSSKDNLTTAELQRREAVIVGMEGREKQLRLAFQQQQTGLKSGQNQEAQRRKLLDSSIVNVGLANDWSNREDEPLLGASSTSDLLSSYHQRRDDALSEQDRGLDALHDVIVRQKHLAQNIQQETEAHNDLIDDIDNGLERTTHRIVNTTENVRIVGRNDKVWKYWLVIFLLVIAIIIIIAMPSPK